MKIIAICLLTLVSSFCYTQTDLLLTDFQLGMPSNYTIVDNDGLIPATQVAEYTSAWITCLDPDNLLDTVASSTSYFSPIGTASRWLITPALTVGSFGNFIEWEAKSQDASFPDDYLVLVSTTDNQVASFTDTIGWIMEENFEWTTRSVNLTDSGYVDQTIYIAFVNTTVNGFKLYIDDIHAWKNDPVNVSELQSPIFVSVYPNPTMGILTLSSDSKIERASIKNTSGQEILVTTEKTINLTSFPSGVYFLNVQTDQGTVVKKILKN